MSLCTSAELDPVTQNHINVFNLKKMKVDWNDVKENVIRAPQIFLQKTNLASTNPSLVDDEIIGLQTNFKNLVTNCKLLQVSLKRYEESAKFMVECGLQTGQSLKSLVADTSKTRSEIDSLFLNKINQYNMVFQDCKPIVIEVLTSLNDRVGSRLKRLESHNKEVASLLRQREYALLDLNKEMLCLERLKAKGNLMTCKEQQKIFTTERKLTVCERNFTKLNRVIKQELPVYLVISKSIIENILQVIYFGTLTVFYELQNKLKSLEHDINLHDADQSHYSTTTKNMELVSVFKAKHAPVALQVDSLKICHFYEKNLRNVASNIPSASTIVTNYSGLKIVQEDKNLVCVAGYNFEKINDQDLSFKRGDHIKVLKQEGSWWKGELNGKVGNFPSNYVELI
ncbi:hypothetical protein LJB42_002794 [Komagataella kurtzmanii]|nr:hypothetical protein LJB42_002794 [Komagataella kurtzmanii]